MEQAADTAGGATAIDDLYTFRRRLKTFLFPSAYEHRETDRWLFVDAPAVSLQRAQYKSLGYFHCYTAVLGAAR